jgi:NAD(P)H-dependent FMN reductase
MTTFKVGYLIGSLAKGSINRKLATALTRLAPEHLTFADSDEAGRLFQGEAGHLFRFHSGQCSDLKPDTLLV